MMKQRLLGWFSWACLFGVPGAGCGCRRPTPPPDSGYKVVRRMPVGGDGGWDYLRVDPDAHRIYVSRGTHLMVVDEVSGKVIGDIPAANTKNMHGIALATDLGKGFTSNGDANTVTVVDLKTLKPISVIPIPGKNPDSIIYDPQDQARLHL